MSDVQPLIFFDRTRRSTDQTCRRRRWWAFEFEGRGISPRARAIYFDIGDIVHKALAALLRQDAEQEETIRDAVEGFRHQVTLPPDKLEEQCALIEGMLRGWCRAVLPRLLEDYNVLHVETEFPYRLRGGEVPIEMGVTPDALLERKSDLTVWYREHKTSGSLDERWFPQWPKAIQLHSTAHIVGERMGRPVEGVIVGGLYKGYENRKAGGRQESIWCYGYARPGTIGGQEILYEYKPGTRKVATWQEQDGVKGWVERMPFHVVQDQFAETPPIYLNAYLVERFFAQSAHRESEIRTVRDQYYATSDPVMREAYLDTYFPQNFDECAPPIGAPCPYGDCCFNPVIADNPLATGLYVPRVPHHALDPVAQSGEAGV